MEIFVCSPNCLLLGGARGFGLMPKSTDADKEAHSWCDAGLFTEWTQTTAGWAEQAVTKACVAFLVISWVSCPPPSCSP